MLLLAAIREFLLGVGELALVFFGIAFALEWVLLFFPEERIEGILTRKRPAVLSSLLGGAFGALTPLCSYSTVPLAISFLRFGVPFEAVASFLFVSPLLNPILASFLATLFGWQRAVLYTVLVFSQTVLLGYLFALVPVAFWVRDDCPRPGNFPLSWERSVPRGEFRRVLRGVWDLAKSILPFLFLGSALGVLVEFFLPQDLIFRIIAPRDPGAILWVSLLGIPLYLRAELVLPLGKAFLEKGVSPGVIVAFLVSGAGGVSIPELALLFSAFRPRFVLLFALLIFFLAVEMGFVFFVLG
ncbi:permease [Candidatus Caldatribacterium sp. SIUC1]|uniref:permease n=1 Tax=Candidatus Caldatribacterium sp. SIUC1 TaxID=3418365 RepID=UPI003F69266D